MEVAIVIALILAVLFLGFGIFKPEPMAQYLGYGSLVVATVLFLYGRIA